jgi:hypothetical protein
MAEFGGHEAYHPLKLCDILFARELACRLHDTAIGKLLASRFCRYKAEARLFPPTTAQGEDSRNHSRP